MDRFLKVLSFLNLLDDTGKTLSITNVALTVLIGKLCLAHNTDWPSIVAVITAFANYIHKRDVISKGTDEPPR